MAIAIGLFGGKGFTQTSPPRKGAHVDIHFAKSPFSDYLFYLLNRSTGDFPQLKTSVPLEGIPAIGQLTFAPEDAISSNISSYSQLYGMVANYDDRARLTDIIKQGEPKFAAFEEFWKTRIAPEEDRRIVLWEKQYAKWHPVERMQKLERITFPFSSINVDVIALDPSGSSMQGAHPTIFTASSSIPDIAWVIGHEGTHMALGPKGANWTQRPGAAEAIRLMKARSGSEYDIEEAFCLLMQAKLSQAFHKTPTNSSVSGSLEAIPRRNLLVSLERDWEKYLNNPEEDAADFIIAEAVATFQSPNSAKGTFEVEVRLLPSEQNIGDTNIARFSMDKKWSGDLAGTSHGQMLGFQSQTEKGTGGGVAMERFTGTLRGRNGSFLLQHNSTMRNGKFEMNISVVPGSGTEDLAGISGTLQIVVEGSKHSYRFEYSISSN